MCIHKPGHNFREAYEKFYDKIYKNNFIEEDYIEDKKLNIPQGFEFVYKKEFKYLLILVIMIVLVGIVIKNKDRIKSMIKLK